MTWASSTPWFDNVIADDSLISWKQIRRQLFAIGNDFKLKKSKNSKKTLKNASSIILQICGAPLIIALVYLDIQLETYIK